ncbi:hypothetical protein VTN77DRAFT_8623 [Rasamsonia byssochlamydoides]|uniref:uncharacterized protein n=1 Tax=Rasamsonia byssochlamydoides TaxID=89139 RepID=UPI00374456AD
MTDKNVPSTSFVETVAGFTAGVISTLCLHPLDLIKTRLQVDRVSPSRLGRSFRVIREIHRTEGGITAFYRGLTPNLVGNSTSWALYFLLYSEIKGAIRNAQTSDKHGLGASEYFLASGAAGLFTAILTNPIWVIKTRMLSTGSRTPGAYPSFVSGARQILTSEGVAGFYRGLVPALFGVSHGAFQFMAYEQLKAYRSRSTWARNIPASTTERGGGADRQFSNLDLLIISSLSKVFAGCITYPYQVLRTRLQVYDAAIVYQGVWDATRKIWRNEGVGGFYKGLGPNLLRVLPNTWVTFLVYENTRRYLLKLGVGDG